MASDLPQAPGAAPGGSLPSLDSFSLPDVSGIMSNLQGGMWTIIGAILSAMFIGHFFAKGFGRRGNLRSARRAYWVIVGTTTLLNIINEAVGLPNLPGLPKMAWWLVVGAPVWLLTRRLIPDYPANARASTPGIGTGTHGSAHFGTTETMINYGHLYAPGVSAAPALGRAETGPDLDPRFRHVGHTLTCAPTGSGKGIGAVIPALLEYPGSMVVLDLKGENYAVTHRARQAMGHDVQVVDPFGVTGQHSAGFNWLDRLDPHDPDVVAESATLADMVIVPDPKAEQHWDELARNLLQGVMVHVAASMPPERRHMGEVRRLLTGSDDNLIELLGEMAVSDAGFGVVSRAANSFIAKADKERSGVLSTAIKHTAFLDDPRIVSTLSRTSFSMADLKRKPMTIYLVMPPARLAAYSRFMRGFVGQALSAITATEQKPPAPVIFLLDEFAQLGRMQAVEDAISLVRGYGAFFWLIVQDLSQLKGVYPRWQTFLANSAKQFFGTADYDTARYISESIGQKTVHFSTASSSSNAGRNGSSYGSSQSEQYGGRSLLTPDEVMRLGPQRPIVLISGQPPYVLHRLNYLHDPEYAGKFDPNPYY